MNVLSVLVEFDLFIWYLIYLFDIWNQPKIHSLILF